MATVAAAYVRKSSTEAKASDQKSINVQLDEIRRFAEARGLNLDEQYVFSDDAVSGTVFAEDQRPGFGALLAALRQPEGAKRWKAPFQVLLVTEQSRIGCDMADTVYALRRIADAGVKVLTTSGEELKPDIMGAVRGHSDEDVARKTSERVLRVHTAKVAAGLVAGGRVYGYRNTKLAAGKTVRTIHEGEAAVVRRIFELAAEGYGFRRIVGKLEGIPGPEPACPSHDELARMVEAGYIDPLAEQHATRTHGDACPRKPWGVSGVREVVQRELYRGVVVWGRTNRSKADGRDGRLRGDERVRDVIRAEVPELRIVSDELWNAVHARIAATRERLAKEGRLRVSASGLKGKHSLAGLLVCGTCGGRLVYTTRGRNATRVYVCGVNRERGRTACGNTSGAPAEQLLHGIIHSLEKSLTPEALDQFIAEREADTEARDLNARVRAGLLERIAK